ncbi:hypothetical protein ZHAS_00020389 [Anopheles sinensis]|uniref:Uncharacterized protein n=1 Tax=Anopheles sinensis TaxID=74873 RepID=A0A084WPX7_ANOSI|nr:hypothetical protein ZHAS_00020389 [Anopheles sinensis]
MVAVVMETVRKPVCRCCQHSDRPNGSWSNRGLQNLVSTRLQPRGGDCGVRVGGCGAWSPRSRATPHQASLKLTARCLKAPL